MCIVSCGGALFLLEQDTAVNEPDLDIPTFASGVARLISNYDSLVDIKASVIDQSQEYLKKNYPKNGEKLSKDLVDLLDKQHNIRLSRKETPSDSYAVGAKSAGGAA